MRHVLLNNAEKVIVNPMLASQIFDMHAIEQPEASAIESSMAMGTMALAITKVPIQSIYKNGGWDATMTSFVLWRYTKPIRPIDVKIATAAKTKHTTWTGVVKPCLSST